MTAQDDIFTRARTVSIIEAVRARGGNLRARGDAARGACPLCGAGEKSKSSPFSAKVKDGLWKCHGCGQSGDVIKFEQLAGGHDGPLAAARALVGEDHRRASAPRIERARPAEPEPETVDSAEVARVILARSISWVGTIVEAWLWARGLDPHGLPGAVVQGGLMFHPACPVRAWAVGAGPESVPTAPAMVAQISGPDGRPWPACHVTYLAADGRAKANLRTARKMFGRVGGGAVWLCRAVGANPLVVGEGIESAWALGQVMGARSVAATLSLDNLQGGAMRDDQGALMLPVAADPARPPFLVPGCRDVVIGIDADMSAIKAKVRAGGVMRLAELGSRERAELCAALATQHWRRMGAAPRALRPAWGKDFNDVMREGVHAVGGVW
ncbi:MAG: hypothetical protein B7Y35_06025 [Sphingomonadales bacterium 28-64-96]|nr:MAG: hypothetical protein B7Y35_06025 [Sphingomonadales bacterium 28-64-96]